MSGHSRWAQIHRQKGVADAKKGAVFTKLGNVITVAAREGGGGSPDSNFKLRLAIDQARAANMPKENIDRAIKRGTGELSGGQLETVLYEGFGPEGVAVVVECLTDNRNRTSSEIKHIFTKYGGSLGAPNSVMWMFEKLGVLRLAKIDENLELELIDKEAKDIKEEEGGVTIFCEPKNLQAIKKLLEDKKIEVEYAAVDLVAKEKRAAAEEKLKDFFAALDENVDVNDYYTNAEV